MDNYRHGHLHNHDVSGIKTANLVITLILNFIITTAEVIGGILAGSLSLVSDALHNLSDALSIIVSITAIKISQKQNDEKRTFGYKRSSILAALINSSVLVGISLFLFKEAYSKFISPETINGTVVIWVALIGLIANFLGAYLLHKGSKGDMNIKSAYLHLFSDALSSVGVLFGGVMIRYFKVYWVDPLLTVAIGIYVLKESFEIIKKVVNVLMQGVPENINIYELVEEIKKIPEVEDVHHVHVWSLDDNNINFEAHVNIKDMMVSETGEVYGEIEHELHEHFGINHVTIQFEYNGCCNVGIIKN
ncbi:MAG: cation diffusion facilitator family transporter [Thermoanaerobacteraceae bacterium]|nr:cation diffusion facilitator family transporter [Thermoanaerobacteraceae bacterium]